MPPNCGGESPICPGPPKPGPPSPGPPSPGPPRPGPPILAGIIFLGGGPY